MCRTRSTKEDKQDDVPRTRPSRQKKPVMRFDPSPLTPKKKRCSTKKLDNAEGSDVISMVNIPENDQNAQINSSVDVGYGGKEEAADPNYKMEDDGGKEENDKEVMESMNGDGADQSSSKKEIKRKRRTRRGKKIALSDEDKFLIPALINLDGTVQEGEKTDEAVQGLIDDDEKIMEGIETMDDYGKREDGFNLEDLFADYSDARLNEAFPMGNEMIDIGPLDDLCGALWNDGENDPFGSHDFNTDSGLFGEEVDMDEDVEEVHEIIEEDYGLGEQGFIFPY